MKQKVATSHAPTPAGAYSQGIIAGDLVFVAGQGGFDPETGVLADGIEAQTEQTFANVAAILEAAGSSLADVVKTTVHLADVADFAAFDAVYRGVMPEPWPVRTTVGSTLIRIAVEIDVVAIRRRVGDP
jgi:2-iminobutanoate/2-iminopropanoate deaminase